MLFSSFLSPSIATFFSNCYRHRALTAAILGCWFAIFGFATSVRGDWPTYRADAARTGFTAESLAGELALAWSYDAGVPSPAWPRSGRMPFDRAYHCVVAGDDVFFACSTDHALYRLDLTTGRGDAIFVGDGPLRFAPTVWQDRLFLVSDDGFLYCLKFDGEVVWKHRGGPSGARRLGNEKLISKWPARCTGCGRRHHLLRRRDLAH